MNTTSFYNSDEIAIYIGYNFSDRDLAGETLSGSFTGSDFSGTNLSGATLLGDFTSANFSGADLSGAMLMGNFADATMPERLLLHVVTEKDEVLKVA